MPPPPMRPDHADLHPARRLCRPLGPQLERVPARGEGQPAIAQRIERGRHPVHSDPEPAGIRRQHPHRDGLRLQRDPGLEQELVPVARRAKEARRLPGGRSPSSPAPSPGPRARPSREARDRRQHRAPVGPACASRRARRVPFRGGRPPRTRPGRPRRPGAPTAGRCGRARTALRSTSGAAPSPGHRPAHHPREERPGAGDARDPLHRPAIEVPHPHRDGALAGEAHGPVVHVGAAGAGLGRDRETEAGAHCRGRRRGARAHLVGEDVGEQRHRRPRGGSAGLQLGRGD